MSLVLVLSSERKLVVAADRRATESGGPTAGDNYRKIFRCGNRSVCATVGWLGYLGGDRPYSISEALAGICARPDLQDQPDRLLAAIRQEIEAGLSSHGQPILSVEFPFFFSASVLRWTRSGTIDFLELQFPIAGSKARPALGAPLILRHLEGASPVRFYFCTGWANESTYDLARILDLESSADNELVDGINEIYRATQRTEHGSEIGGPIDMVCLDSSGFRRLNQAVARA